MHELQLITDNGNFILLKENPVSLLQFVNKYCEVQLLKTSTLSGFVHSVDPISLSVIIVVPQADAHSIFLIPGHAVINIRVIQENSEITMPLWKSESVDTFINFSDRKLRVMEWLKTNLLPVSESNENLIIGNVIILPPYNVTDICTNNPIVATQISQVLEKMPHDFDPK